MDTFPDLGSLSDQELKDLIQQLTEEEIEISYRRRILHGKIDILRAELVNRLRKKHEGGEDVITGADVQKLTDILAGRAGRRRRRSRASGEAGGGSMAVHCPECGFVNAEGANYCQRAARTSGGRERRRRRRAVTATYRIDETGELVPVDARATSSARGRRARHPRRRRPRGGELPAAGRAHDDRPAARLRHLPRRRHRLARPRAARAPRRRLATSTTSAR